MKMLVLGAGLQGSAAAHNLLQHDAVELVTLADLHVDRLPRLLQPYQGERLHPVQLDAGDFAGTVGLMKGHDAALCALPYYFNEPMTRAAIESGCHLCDLGGNTEIVFQQKKHHDAAAAAGVSIVPDCGLAPGMVNILAAEGIRRLDPGRGGGASGGGFPSPPNPRSTITSSTPSRARSTTTPLRPGCCAAARRSRWTRSPSSSRRSSPRRSARWRRSIPAGASARCRLRSRGRSRQWNTRPCATPATSRSCGRSGSWASSPTRPSW